MTWEDRLSNIEFSITTGDGRIFKPLSKDWETSKDFNTAAFDFIGKDGTLIDRKKVKGRKFPLKFWFTGANNVELSESFDASANDNRAWKINHPFYGAITGHPLSIGRNDTSYNATEFNVDFWETIVIDGPRKDIAFADSVKLGGFELGTVSALDYATTAEPGIIDIATVRENAGKISLNIEKYLNAIDYSEYQVAKISMFSKIDNLISAPAPAIEAINDLVGLPAEFALSVDIRFNMLEAVYNTALETLGIRNNRNNKAYFESVGASAIAGIALAMLTPLSTDFVTRSMIVSNILRLSNLVTAYKNVLDAAVVPISNPKQSFSASAATQSALNTIIINTITALNQLAFNAKQERVILTDRDTNLIVLTHKYMGLDVLDKNIETFRAINNIKNSGLLNIKKGTPITYYV